MSYCFDGATPWNRSRLRSVKRHGGVAVSVYIVGTPGGMRCAVKQDVDLARSMGLGVLPNWERAADFFAHCDRAQARGAGVEALAACRELGIPDDGTKDVAFSFDFQIPVSRYPEMALKLALAGEGLGGHYRAVAYGQYGFIDYLARNGQQGPHWLMGSTFRASSQFYASEVGSKHVAMVQMHDAAGGWLSSPVSGTDINTITQPQALGAWWPPNSTHAQGDVMATDQFTTLQAQIAALATKVDGIPARTWQVKLKDPTDASGKTEYPVSSWLVYSNLRAKDALAAAQAATAAAKSVAGSIAVDAATVAEQIKARLIQIIGGTP